MRRMIRSGFLLLLLAGFFSCRPRYSPEPVYTVFNDFESVAGWVSTPSNNSQSVSPEDAHSGKYSYKVDKDHSFGYYYKNKLSEISDKKIKWVKVSGYCKAKTDKLNKACVVCTVQDNTDAYLKWSQYFLEEFTQGKKDKWVHFEKSCDISTANRPELYFSSFVWSNDAGDVLYIDDFKLEFFD